MTDAELSSLARKLNDVDTSKLTGRLVAHVLAAVAEFEPQRIRERTSEALAQVKASGKRLGRPRQTPDDVVGDIVRKRQDGLTLQAIAEELNRPAGRSVGRALPIVATDEESRSVTTTSTVAHGDSGHIGGGHGAVVVSSAATIRLPDSRNWRGTTFAHDGNFGAMHWKVIEAESGSLEPASDTNDVTRFRCNDTCWPLE